MDNRSNHDQQRRARRTTAGKRMNFLTGQALEDDEAFWGHDTWESDNESFHSSDQEEAPDVFDSDFDETEESSDEEQEAAEAEKEIAAEERNNKKRKAGYNEGTSNFGKPQGGAFKKAKGKRIVGDEHNAGIVLNVPGGPTVGTQPVGGIARPKKAPVAFATSASVPALASTRQRRSAREASGYSNEAREAAAAAAEEAQRKQPAAAAAKTTKAKTQEKFQQADLLLEAVNDTEPSNERWLLGRKRIQEEKELSTRDKGTFANSTYTEKFVSRRGYLNTINFADMDRIPKILLQKKQASQPPKVPLCAVTRKPARYRDPKSGYGYYDLEAFRVIRAKWIAEQKEQEAENAQRSSIAMKTNGDCDHQDTEKAPGNEAPGNGNSIEPAPNENPSTDSSAEPKKPTAKATKKRPERAKGKTAKKRTSNAANGIPVSPKEPPVSTPSTNATATARTTTPPPQPSIDTFEHFPVSPKSQQHQQSSVSPSSRKSPRRRKPTTRMLESIDEGLLPAMPESTSTMDRAASLAPRNDDG